MSFFYTWVGTWLVPCEVITKNQTFFQRHNRYAQSIFNSLNYIYLLINFLNWSSVIGVRFDGEATTYMSEFNNGVQAKCKEKNNSIMYLHCYTHCLN